MLLYITTTRGEKYKVTCDNLFILYSYYQKWRYASGTYSRRVSQLRVNFIPLCGNKTPEEVTEDDINDVYTNMSKAGRTSNSIFAAREALLSFFSFAMQCGLLEYNPVAFAEPVPRPQQKKSA